MALPTQKRTKSSKKQRQLHLSLKKTILIKCPQCGKPKLPYHACGFCGTYRGRQVIKFKIRKKTTKQKAQERKEKTREKEANKI